MTFLNVQIPFSAKLILKLDGYNFDEEFSLRIMPNVDNLRIDKILMPYGKENTKCRVMWTKFQGEDWFVFLTYQGAKDIKVMHYKYKDKVERFIKEYTQEEFLKTYDLNSSIKLSETKYKFLNDYIISWHENRCKKIKIYTNYGEFDVDPLSLPFDADWMAKTNQQNE